MIANNIEKQKELNILRFKNALNKSKKNFKKKKFVNTDDLTVEIGEQGYE